MIARASLMPGCAFSRDGFGALLFRRCVADGHIFWTAPPEVQTSMGELSDRLHLPHTQPSGEAWQCEDLLPASQTQRLRNYRKACHKRSKPLDCIVNLQQEAHFARCLSGLVPCLLTRTSTIWSMRHSRLLIPSEFLGAMGVPIFAADRHENERFNVEVLALDGSITAKEVRHLAGNAMCLSAVGSVLLLALATSLPVALMPAASSAASREGQPPVQAKRLPGDDGNPRPSKRHSCRGGSSDCDE